MKTIKLITLSLLFISCSDNNIFRTFVPPVQEIVIKGCLNEHASNLNIQATTEEGSCTFSYCPQYGYEGYEESKAQKIQEYIDFFGPEFLGVNRVTNTCGDKLEYCEHLEAKNYIAGPYPIAGYHSEFCYFEACNDINFEGRAKYDEYTQYLLSHPGVIEINNSPQFCGERKIITTESKLDPFIENSDYDEAEISFVLDDSGSMSDEIQNVRKALIDLADQMHKLKADIKLSFYRLSGLFDKPTLLSNQQNANGFYDYAYDLPSPIGTVIYNKDATVSQIRSEITNVLQGFEIDMGFSRERGACMTMHHLNKLQREGFKERKKNLFVLITDEDEYDHNDTTRCSERVESRSNTSFVADVVHSYTGENGEERYTSALYHLFNNKLTSTQKESYGWLGIFYDKDKSSCTGEASGDTYKELLTIFKISGVEAFFGDICSDNYTDLISEKLIQGFLNKVTLRYKFFEHPSTPIVNSVSVKLKDNTIVVIPKNQYLIIKKDNDHSIEFKEEQKPILENSIEILVNFTYQK